MPLAAHLTAFYLKSSAAAVTGADEAKGITKEDIKVNGEQLDVTDFKDTSGWRLYVQGLKNGAIDFSGFVEPADAPQSLVRSSLLTYADLWCEIQRNPSGAGGQKGFRGQVMVENYNESADVAGLVTFTCALRFTGAVATV